jgi:hypothetical protein
MSTKATKRFTYKVSAEARSLATKSLKVLEAERARDLKAGNKALYIDEVLLLAVCEAYVRGETVEALQAQASMAYQAGSVHNVGLGIPNVRRYEHLTGKASKSPSEVNDRPDNAIQTRLDKWATLKGMAWVKTLQARRALAYGAKVKATDPEWADTVVFAKR